MKEYLMVVIGRSAYWIGWPVLYLYLKGTTRTRVVISFEGKILVVRGWLGDGRWELPGGGAKKNETVEECAIREVMEETGIIIETQQLRRGESFYASNNKIRYRCTSFFTKLGNHPSILPRRSEIAYFKWVLPVDLTKPDTEAGSLKVIQSFKQQNLL